MITSVNYEINSKIYSGYKKYLYIIVFITVFTISIHQTLPSYVVFP